MSEHYRVGPGKCACGFDAYKIDGIMVDYHIELQAHMRTAPERDRVMAAAEQDEREAAENTRIADLEAQVTRLQDYASIIREELITRSPEFADTADAFTQRAYLHPGDLDPAKGEDGQSSP